MRTLPFLLFLLTGGSAMAAGFERPVPAAQTAQVELWFAMASLGLIAALAAAAWLVSRR